MIYDIFVKPSFAKTYLFLGCPTREHPIQSCPGVKHGFSKFMPATFNDHYSKYQSERELKPFKWKIIWNEWNSRNKDFLFFRTAC